ncbi:MAG: alpha/beta fold hydrolase [Armatimonadota bacterium]|nr:alpha/beta fold hydrolase [Armatimonadota bacterium]MDR5689278.1 alpha/beta fold hydrolase [Armatimonadota bacterium]MDR7599577.1 alpha/beta fold hydrolase [Armatimonadota bacterium]
MNSSVHPTVVLLHGAGADCAGLSWKHVAPRLARKFAVLAPDLPGHGGTPELPRPTTEAYLDWLCRWMDGAGVERASLVGLSLGGALAVGYALRRPERVDRLVLVASYGLSPRVPYHGLLWFLLRSPLQRLLRAPGLRRGPGLWLSVRFLVGDPGSVDAELLGDVRAALRGTSPGLFWRWLQTEVGRARVRTYYGDRLRDLRCPVLLIHGDRDRLVPMAHAEQAARRIPQAQLVILRGCGHWPPRERPEGFWSALEAFLVDVHNFRR